MEFVVSTKALVPHTGVGRVPFYYRLEDWIRLDEDQGKSEQSLQFGKGTSASVDRETGMDGGVSQVRGATPRLQSHMKRL